MALWETAVEGGGYMGGTNGNRMVAGAHRHVAGWTGWQKCATQGKQFTFVDFGYSWEPCDNVVIQIEFGMVVLFSNFS